MKYLLGSILVVVGVIFMVQLTSDPKTNIALIKKASENCFPESKIVAHLAAAQAILESGLQSKPSKLAMPPNNNLFGIKGKGTDGSVTLMTKEWSKKGGWVEVPQKFAKNKSAEDSIAQHKKLFEKGTSDNPNRYKNLFSAKTFEEAATLVHKDGYATDPGYPKKLIDIYNKYIKE